MVVLSDDTHRGGRESGGCKRASFFLLRGGVSLNRPPGGKLAGGDACLQASSSSSLTGIEMLPWN